MKRAISILWLIFCACAGGFSQNSTPVDILGSHDMGSGANALHGNMSSACLYCHVPHSGTSKGPLWGQTFSTQSYTLYTSDTLQNEMLQPVLGATSSLCLSCHDGTVAPGLSMPYGQIPTAGKMISLVGTKLESSHPFSLKLPLKDAPHLVSTLVSSGTTADTTNSVKLINGTIECNTCHNPHNQFIDKNSPNFLVLDNKNGALCLACHETAARTVNNLSNPLVGWKSSIHATSTAALKASSGLGTYENVGQVACASCHVQHNAGAGEGLMRNPSPPPSGIDSASLACIGCHGGTDKMGVPLRNVFTETQKRGHPFPTSTNAHSPIEAVLLNQNRHAGCVDCHNSHAAQPTDVFNQAPNIRPSMNGVDGVIGDKSGLYGPATMQYQVCLRCHGDSTGKPDTSAFGPMPRRVANGGDQGNLIPQFGSTAGSEHPVMRDATGVAQPSLLASMYNIGGGQGHQMGTRIYCTDCHNSDDNREFGGDGPNGPHGSVNDHILERNYRISQVAAAGGPGSEIINTDTNPSTDPANASGSYALCAKCHNLVNILSNDPASFREHRLHIKDVGASCSVCHSAHGVPPGGTAVLNGKRLVNFDINVVAPYNGVISYDGNSCTLRCHGEGHNAQSANVARPTTSTK